MGLDLAKQLGFGFCEVSAKSNLNIELVLKSLVTMNQLFDETLKGNLTNSLK
jgi:hypothetical protein